MTFISRHNYVYRFTSDGDVYFVVLVIQSLMAVVWSPY